MENLPLNEYVKAKRKALGFSREEFAQKAGVGLRFLRELEQGKETLKMDKVNQVLKLFGVQLGVVPMDRNNLICYQLFFESEATNCPDYNKSLNVRL